MDFLRPRKLNKNLHRKKTFLAYFSLVCFLAVSVFTQGQIIKVEADIIPVSVNISHLDFGTVFSGESLKGDFIVNYVDEGDGIEYRIIQKRKPLSPEHSEYPDGGDPEMPGYYRDLCPYLTKISNEGEGDIEAGAFVGPDDLTDKWIVYFEVPAIFGNVAQDHTGGVVSINGEYGCDISIDIDEIEECCTPDSEDFGLLDDVNIGSSTSESSISGWSPANIPGNYGGCQQGAVCDYRQILGDSGNEGSCTEGDRDAIVVLSAGSDVPVQLTIRHLDGISLLDSFEVYVNEILVGSFIDETQVSSEIWRETTFDISSHSFSGDLTVRLHATDPIWSQCNTYGQVSIDWIEVHGCSTPQECIPSNEVCDNGTDDDCDGEIDCNDSDCFDDPYCGFTPACVGCSCDNSCGGGHIFPDPDPDPVVVLGEEGAPILEINKEVDTEFANIGDEVNYEVIISNIGNLTAFNVVLNDILPDGFVFSDDQTANRTWSLGDIEENQSQSVNYLVTVNAGQGIYSNLAQASADNHGVVSDYTDLEVREVVVLGVELPATGFSQKEFLILISSIILLFSAAFVLRRKYIS